MKDFVRLTLDNGHYIDIRASVIAAVYQRRIEDEWHTRIDLSSGAYYHIQEPVDKVLELIEGREEYGSIGIPDGIPPGTIIGQVDDVEIEE